MTGRAGAVAWLNTHIDMPMPDVWLLARTISGEMYGIITTLLAGRGSLLTPIAAPIAFLAIKTVLKPTFGRVALDDANYAIYQSHLRRTTDEPFALFLPG